MIAYNMIAEIVYMIAEIVNMIARPKLSLRPPKSAEAARPQGV